ncbi:AAA family ATPase [Nocardia crassostreae]|uniref:AAA family ATPase n=1 Tax=Nocardia crassostreae TaxID=53428 RepID=UPI001FE06DF0|nr:AAA family ATPase [Nocardia crassostreae]
MTNHRSLAEPQELRLTRGNGPIATSVTAVYGAAATGKTGLVDALDRMRDAVLNSVTGWDPYSGPVRTPYLGFADRPSEFVAHFVAEGCPYTYGFRLGNADVQAEWLHSHPHNRKRIVFERAGDDIRIGPMFEAARDALYSRMVARRGVGLGLTHEGIDTAFDIADESTATLAMLRLLPPMLDALDAGGVFAVDDIAANLTPEAADSLIQLFQNPETNTHGAQLVFTTANRTLIDRGNGRSQATRTTVWQVRRTPDGTSELTPQ